MPHGRSSRSPEYPFVSMYGKRCRMSDLGRSGIRHLFVSAYDGVDSRTETNVRNYAGNFIQIDRSGGNRCKKREKIACKIVVFAVFLQNLLQFTRFYGIKRHVIQWRSAKMHCLFVSEDSFAGFPLRKIKTCACTGLRGNDR